MERKHGVIPNSGYLFPMPVVQRNYDYVPKICTHQTAEIGLKPDRR